MAPIEWFYAKGNRRLGPVTSMELKQLAEESILDSNDLVWHKGLGDWVEAHKVKGLFDSAGTESTDEPVEAPDTVAPPAAPPIFTTSHATFAEASPTDRHHVFDHLLRSVRSQFDESFVDSAGRLFAVAGHFGIFAAVAVTVPLGILIGVKHDCLLTMAPACMAGIVILLVLQYASDRFTEALDLLNRKSPGKITSTALPDCLALLVMFIGVCLLFGLSVQALLSREYLLILPAVGAFILSEYLAITAINPGALGFSVTPNDTIGEEAIALLALLAKLMMRLVPVAYGIGIILATVAWGISAVHVLMAAKPIGPDAWGAMFASATALVAAAALPLLGLLLFLALFLVVDLAAAILMRQR